MAAVIPIPIVRNVAADYWMVTFTKKSRSMILQGLQKLMLLLMLGNAFDLKWMEQIFPMQHLWMIAAVLNFNKWL